MDEKFMCGLTAEEYSNLDRFEKIKIFHQDLNERCENGDENAIKFREELKQKKKEKQKEYYQKNKERGKEKVKCECGSEVAKHSLTKHRKSYHHRKYLDTI